MFTRRASRLTPSSVNGNALQLPRLPIIAFRACYGTAVELLPVGAQATNSRSPDLDADAATDAIVDPADPELSLLQGMESALDLIGASTQWVVAGSVGVALVMRADPETLVWVLGSLFNAVFSKVLKKGINQVGCSF